MDFVEDVVPLTIQLSEQHGLNVGSFYGRGLSGHDKASFSEVGEQEKFKLWWPQKPSDLVLISQISKWLFGLEYLPPLKSSYSSLVKLAEMEEVHVCSNSEEAMD